MDRLDKNQKLLEDMHAKVDELVIDLNQNLRDGLLCLSLPGPSTNVTIAPHEPSPQAQLNNLKMQLSTEKVVMNVHEMLQLIREIRAQVMLHDQ
jgi:hypothetical protein